MKTISLPLLNNSSVYKQPPDDLLHSFNYANDSKNMNWAEHMISFYRTLSPPQNLPGDIEWLYPQRKPEIFSLTETFFKKYYSDEKQRKIFLGINPGRYGAGITGVNFTAPKQLREDCAIEHTLGNGTELSAEFIYHLIREFGGTEKFYSNYFIGSVCPLGFTRRGKNLNYYDDNDLLEKIEPFITKNISRLISYQTSTEKIFCIGGEKNYKYLLHLNGLHKWFGEIIPLPHPRFIMQYRRKQLQQFVHKYLQLITV